MSVPDFLILGAAKSGTTSLIQELLLHPDVHALRTEINYFTQRYYKGHEWYTSLFDSPDKKQGEKSTSYLYETDCHERIFNCNPDAKLIVLLRDPVKRAFSNWNMRHVQGRLIKQAHAFNKGSEIPLLNIGFKHLFAYYLACDSPEKRHQEPLDIFGRGLYVAQIEHLLKFFPRHQLLILVAESYFEKTDVALAEVSKFLNICSFSHGAHAWERKSDYPIRLDVQTALDLSLYYQPYNERLFTLLGYEIPQWNPEKLQQ